MSVAEVLSYGVVALILFGSWRYRTRTDAFLSFLFGGLLVGSAVAAVAFGFEGLILLGPWVALLWGLDYGLYLFALRTDNAVHVDGPASLQPTIDAWAEAGFTESSVFRMRPNSGHIVIAMRRPGEATTAFFHHRGNASVPELWSFFTPLGQGEGTLITTAGISGLLDLGEVRQITSDADSGWELHQDGVAFVAEHGIETGQRIGNGFDDFLLWTRDRDRAALRRFPIGLLSANFRPIFHYGPLRTRRRAPRQLRRFSRSP